MCLGSESQLVGTIMLCIRSALSPDPAKAYGPSRPDEEGKAGSSLEHVGVAFAIVLCP